MTDTKPRKRKFQKHSKEPSTAVTEKTTEIKVPPYVKPHSLPMQRTNPFLPEQQLTIVIFAFDLDRTNWNQFDADEYKSGLEQFVKAEEFFKTKKSRGKRSKSTTHLQEIAVPIQLTRFGARCAIKITSTAQPANLHTIQQLFNNQMVTQTLWLYEHEVKQAAADSTRLKLGIKVMHYEFLVARWGWITFESVVAYTNVMDFVDE